MYLGMSALGERAADAQSALQRTAMQSAPVAASNNEDEELSARIQPALLGAPDVPAAARRIAAILRRHGIGKAPDDWLLLERAGDQHCWDVLAEITAQEKLTAVQIARLRLELCGQSSAPSPARDGSKAAIAEPRLRLPLWRIFRKHSLPDLLEVMFLFTNRPGWYRAVFDALDGDRLQQTLAGSSEIFLIVGALNMGGVLTLISHDLTRPQTPASPLHIICLSVNLFSFLLSFSAVLVQLYTLHIYLPVHRNNLRDVVRSTRMLPMTGGLYFAMSAWGLFAGIIFEAMRPLEGVDNWLFREQDLDVAARAVPVIVLLGTFVIIYVPFFVQISATARLVAHSTALTDGQVLPPEAVSWPADAAKRSLAAAALRNPDLEKLYVRHRRAASEEEEEDGPRVTANWRKRVLLGMRKRPPPPPRI